MPKDDLVYVGHMLDAARKALKMIDGKDRPVFDADETLQLAVIHLLQIVGEAAGKLSLELRGARPEVPWPAMTAMRHKLVHEYFGVDLGIVWDTVVKKLPPLVEMLEEALPSDGDS